MSFYTALTGLNGSQADISATSNNIANVATTGYKRSKAEFGDIFATSPLQNASSSIGSGTILKGIKQQFTQGNVSSSLNALDMAISGQGFFALKPSLTTNQTVYTRNGSFSVNNDRFVVDSAGQFVLALPVSDDGSVQEVESNRLNELMSILEETEGKAIIWANYQRDVAQIIEHIEKKYGEGSIVDYYGLTPQEDRQDNIRKFQNDSNCRFLIGTPQTGGYGITLTQANTVIYYSNGYDLEKRLQSEDRAHRIGQKKTVTYVDLICEDTVDEKIVKALRDKINIASEVMGEELRDWI